MKIQQTLRNARFIGEMAFKGVEREIRKRLIPPPVAPLVEDKLATPFVDSEEPLTGYGLLTARQIIEQSRSWSDEQRLAARSYEEATRQRRSVIQALS